LYVPYRGIVLRITGIPCYMCALQMDDSLFDKAIENVLDTPKRDCVAKIGSLDVASGTEDIVYSPIDSTIIFGRLQDPEPGTVTRAADNAAEAFKTWSKTAPRERKVILEKLVTLMEPRLYRLAAECVLSTGMTREDAFNEAVSAIEAVKRAVDACGQPMGKPLGVWAVIALRSSPLASVAGYTAMALAAGNTVVMMPSGACPKPAFAVFDLFKLAGIPDGVLNIVCDRVDRFVPELCDNLSVLGVVASGCGHAMDEMMFLAVDDDLHFVNEVKGMNPVVVSAPGDIKKAADTILSSATANSGMGLYACSKILVNAEDERDLLAALVEKLKDLKVGDPTMPGTLMGPLMNGKTVEDFMKLKEEYMPFVAYGGKKVPCDADGRYYSPLLLTGLDSEDELLYADSGLPVIVIRPYVTLDMLVEELDQTDCGLSVGIISTDSKTVTTVKKFASEGGFQVWGNEGSRGLRSAVRGTIKDFCKN